MLLLLLRFLSGWDNDTPTAAQQPALDTRISHPPTGIIATLYSSRAFSPSAFQLGEKVPKADEGALALAEQWTIFMDGRWKLMKTRIFSARTAPSSAFGTFSPRKKPRGEKDSRLRESQAVQEDCEKCDKACYCFDHVKYARTSG